MTILQFFKAAFFKPLPRLNILKTLYFNFKTLPFEHALHLPVHLYGKWNFRSMNGKVIIPADQIRFGAYKFGFDTAGYFTSYINTLSLHRGAVIKFGEGVNVGQGVHICLYPNAVLNMKKFAMLGDNVKLIDYKSIEIGERTDITWECQISDFNSHFILDSSAGKISTICKPVIIGDYCWICNRTVVMPGTKLPNRTIVASGSLLNRDYTKFGLPERTLIGGAPAKLIKEGVYRIYNRDNEKNLKDFFRKNPGETIYDVSDHKSLVE